MQPEAVGAEWDHTPDVAQRAARRGSSHHLDRRPRGASGSRNVDGPFFGWVSFTDPHHPMDPPAPWCDRYTPDDVLEVLPEIHPDEFDGKPPLHKILAQGLRGRPLEWANPGGATLTREELAVMTAGYYGMVAQLDHAIGRVLDVLDERGLADDTLVIVTSDHGEFLGEHQMIFKGPFGYDSLLRVPLLVRGPACRRRRRGHRSGRHDRSRADDARRPRAWTCRSGWKAARCSTVPREYVLTENDFNIVTSIPMRTITTTRYKLHRYLEAPFGELYDLHDDPGEVVNRYDDPAYASVRSDLLALLDDVMNHDVRKEPTVGLVA